MSRLALFSAILLALVAASPATAGLKAPADFNQRPVEIPANLFPVPPPLFEESAKVESLCMANTVRPPIIDRANHSYLRDAEIQKVMANGRRITELSYQWAYAMEYNLTLRELGAPQGQGADVDFNVSVLNTVMAQIELTETRHYADIFKLELDLLNEIEAANRPGPEVFALLKRVDQFSEDNKVCSDRPMGRAKSEHAVRRQGWPTLNFPQERAAEWNDIYAKKGQIQQALNATYERLALKAFNENYPDIVARMNQAQTVDALNAYVKSIFGDGRLFYLLKRRVRNLEIDISERAQAIGSAPGAGRRK